MKCSEIEVRDFVATCNFVQEYHLKDFRIQDSYCVILGGTVLSIQSMYVCMYVCMYAPCSASSLCMYVVLVRLPKLLHVGNPAIAQDHAEALTQVNEYHKRTQDSRRR